MIVVHVDEDSIEELVVATVTAVDQDDADVLCQVEKSESIELTEEAAIALEDGVEDFESCQVDEDLELSE